METLSKTPFILLHKRLGEEVGSGAWRHIDGEPLPLLVRPTDIRSVEDVLLRDHYHPMQRITVTTIRITDGRCVVVVENTTQIAWLLASAWPGNLLVENVPKGGEVAGAEKA